MELLAKIANSFQPLTIFAKISVLHVWKVSQYASETMWLVAAKSTNDIACKCPNTDQITLTSCKRPTLKQILHLLLVNINFFSEVTVNDLWFQKAAENLIFEGSVSINPLKHLQECYWKSSSSNCFLQCHWFPATYCYLKCFL